MVDVWDAEILWMLNTLRPRQDGRYFADDVLKCIFLNENVWISLTIPLKFLPKGPINNIPVLVQIMAWRRPGDKPLSEPRMESLLTHICVTWPQWVNMISWAITYDFMSCHVTSYHISCHMSHHVPYHKAYHISYDILLINHTEPNDIW